MNLRLRLQIIARFAESGGMAALDARRAVGASERTDATVRVDLSGDYPEEALRPLVDDGTIVHNANHACFKPNDEISGNTVYDIVAGDFRVRTPEEWKILEAKDAGTIRLIRAWLQDTLARKRAEAACEAAVAPLREKISQLEADLTRFKQIAANSGTAVERAAAQIADALAALRRGRVGLTN